MAMELFAAVEMQIVTLAALLHRFQSLLISNTGMRLTTSVRKIKTKGKTLQIE
jgi:hypothetical protein